MDQDDLIKKLEDLETPEIELRGHRQALKAALLDSPRFRGRTGAGWARILAPAAAAVVLIGVVGFLQLVQPGLHMAQAREIARNDPHVQALIAEQNLHIADVKLRDGQAFVVVTGYYHVAASEGTDVFGGGGVSPLGRSIVLFSKAITEGLRPAPDQGSAPPPLSDPDLADPPLMDELLRGYVLHIDLRQKTVSGIGEVERTWPVAHINLDAIEFVAPDQAGAATPHESGGDGD